MKRTFIAACAAAFIILCAAATAAGSGDGSTPASPTVVRLATHVPAAVLDTVGAVKLSPQLEVKQLGGGTLSADGKPQLLAESLAWCPHCAAESWSLTIALSRFGSFRGLRQIDSGTYFKVDDHTKGLSFYGARYTSSYLAFKDIVLASRSNRTLEKPTRFERSLVHRIDPKGDIPVLDVGGGYGVVNSGFDPGVVHGHSALAIVRSLADPTSPIARHVDGFANLLTAAICAETNQQPVSVCGSAGVQAAAKGL